MHTEERLCEDMVSTAAWKSARGASPQSNIAVMLILEFQPPELRYNNLCCFSHQTVVFSYGSPSKLIHRAYKSWSQNSLLHWINMYWILCAGYWNYSEDTSRKGHCPSTQYTGHVPTLYGEAMPCHEGRLAWSRRSGRAFLKKLLLTWGFWKRTE